jgi:hypothetical protein
VHGDVCARFQQELDHLRVLLGCEAQWRVSVFTFFVDELRVLADVGFDGREVANLGIAKDEVVLRPAVQLFVTVH